MILKCSKYSPQDFGSVCVIRIFYYAWKHTVVVTSELIVRQSDDQMKRNSVSF